MEPRAWKRKITVCCRCQYKCCTCQEVAALRPGKKDSRYPASVVSTFLASAQAKGLRFGVGRHPSAAVDRL